MHTMRLSVVVNAGHGGEPLGEPSVEVDGVHRESSSQTFFRAVVLTDDAELFGLGAVVQIWTRGRDFLHCDAGDVSFLGNRSAVGVGYLAPLKRGGSQFIAFEGRFSPGL